MLVKNIIACFPKEALYLNKYRKFVGPTYSGLGDIMQGIFFIKNISDEFGLNFFVDFSGSGFEDYVNDSCYKFNKPRPELVLKANAEHIEFIIKEHFHEDLFICCSGSSDYFPMQDDFDFKQILLNIFFSNKFNEFEIGSSSLHVRLGDNYISERGFLSSFYSLPRYPFNPYKWFDFLSEKNKHNIILEWISKNNLNFEFLSSDSYFLKKFLKKYKNFSSNTFAIKHSGLKSSTSKDCLFALKDFQQLSFSNEINSIVSFPYGRRRSAFSSYARFLSPKQFGKDYYFDFDDNSIALL